MKTLKSALLAALVTGLAAVPSAQAANATWNGTTDAIWATGTNWSATPVPGTGDTATFDNAGGGNTTLDLGTGVTLGNLVFDTATAYTIGSGGLGSQSLTLNNGGSITMGSGFAPNHTIGAALTLGTDGSTQTFTFNINNGQLMPRGGIVGSTGAGTKTIVIQGTGGSAGGGGFYNNNIGISDGAGGGKVGLTVNLGGGYNFASDVANTMSGPLVIKRGTLSLQGAVNNFANVTDITLGSDTWQGNNIGPSVDFRNDLGNNQRVNTSASVTSVGWNRWILRGNASEASTESLGTYTSQSGVATIETQLANQGGAGSDANPMVAWSIGNLVRNTGGGIVNMQGSATETGKQWAYNLGQGTGPGNAQITATTINGAAPSSAMINGIVPWAILVGNGNVAGQGHFATYGANGFKPYGFAGNGTINDNGGTEIFVTTIGAGTSTSNVRDTVGGEEVTGTKIINSLTVEMSAAGNDITGSGTLGLTSGGLIYNSSGAINPKIDFQGREGIIYANGFLTLNGALQNDGGNGVTFSTLSADLVSYGIRLNAAGTWTGPTRIVNGVVQANGSNLLPNTALRVDANAALSIEGNTSVASLSGGGLIGTRNGAASPVLTVGSDNTSTTFSGILGNTSVANLFTSSNVGLTKVGTGTLTLTGVNPYTGNTTVSAGTLLINGSASASAVNVSAGGKLGGSGTIGGAVTVNDGGTLSPGNSIGQLTVGTLNIESGANLVFELTNNSTAGTTYDQIVGTSLVLNGGTVNLTLDGVGSQSISLNDSFTLFTGAVTNFGTTTFNIINNTDWTGGWQISEGSLVVTAIPEPATWALLTFSLTTVMVLRRRQQL